MYQPVTFQVLSQQLAEYIKNVRRVRVSYLKEDEARTLIERPVDNFGLSWEPEATDLALYWSGLAHTPPYQSKQ